MAATQYRIRGTRDERIRELQKGGRKVSPPILLKLILNRNPSAPLRAHRRLAPPGAALYLAARHCRPLSDGALISRASDTGAPPVTPSRREPPARHVVVPCASGRHRVRLGRGIRFWRSARCPTCRAAVDPRRTARVTAWIANLGRPASSSAIDRTLWWSSLGYAAAVVLAGYLLWRRGDVWWPATALLFGPRWILAIPLAILLPAAALRDRALLVPLALVALLVAGPIAELRTGWRGLFTRPDAASDIRVVTFNVQGGTALASTAVGMVQLWDADILIFQECGGALRSEINALADPPQGPTDYLPLPSWSADVRATLCVLSRFPIHEVEEMERAALRAAGGSGLVVTYRMSLGDRPIHVTNIHLETPRDGFLLLRAGEIRRSIPTIREKSQLRMIELEQARRWANRVPDIPHLVAGDFNTPPESRAYRNAWADWTNAFSRVGRGYGGTRLNGWIRPRIDHILVNEGWTVVDARVGEDLGSDHLPVVATVRLRDASR